MSLNVIHDPREATDENDAVVRYTLCFITILIGIREITEKNLPEFYARIKLLEKLDGSFMKQADTAGLLERPVTIEDLRSWIGLKTNASEMTRSQFMKTISNRVDSYAGEVRRGTAS